MMTQRENGVRSSSTRVLEDYWLTLEMFVDMQKETTMLIDFHICSDEARFDSSAEFGHAQQISYSCPAACCLSSGSTIENVWRLA